MGRKLKNTLAASLVGLVGSLALALPASAGRGNGIVQPGDINGCTVGPVVPGPGGPVVFRPLHCSGSKPKAGRTTTIDGRTLPLMGDNASADSEWYRSNVAWTNTTISTKSEGDKPSNRLLQPWIGMTIQKSGKTSNTTRGVAYSSPAGVGTQMLVHMKVCKGDSGSPAFVEMLGQRFTVGMVTNGNGSLHSDPRKPVITAQECSRTPQQPFVAGIRDIEQMCTAANLQQCLAEAGAPLGAFDVATGDTNSVRVLGWAVDPSAPSHAVRVRVVIDGVPAGDIETSTTRGDVRDALMLGTLRPSGQQLGYDAVVGASAGNHTVCVEALNLASGPGNNTPLGCKNVTVAGSPGADDGTFEGGLGTWQLRQGNTWSNWALYNRDFAHDGRMFLAFNTNFNGSVFRDTAATTGPGQNVVLTASLRSQESSASGSMCIWALGSTNQVNCTRYNVGTAWETMQVVLDPDAVRGTIRTEFYPDANGTTTFIDTVKLQVLTPAVIQGSFEGGLGAWQLRQGDTWSNWALYNFGAAHDGGWFLAFNTNRNGSVFQDIATTTGPGQRVVLTAALRSQESSASGAMCIWALGSTNQVSCNRYNVGSRWETLEVVLNSDAHRGIVRIEFYPDANGTTTFIDTVNLRVE